MRGGVKMGLFRRSNKDEAKKIISDQVGDLLLKALIENEKMPWRKESDTCDKFEEKGSGEGRTNDIG